MAEVFEEIDNTKEEVLQHTEPNLADSLQSCSEENENISSESILEINDKEELNSAILPSEDISEASPQSDETTKLKCPSCGQEFLVSNNGVSGFLNNQFIIENTDGAGATSDQTLGPADRVCTSCEDESKVSSYCVNCEEWLCKACVQAHQRVKVTRDHSIKTREEFEQDEELNKESNKASSSPGRKPLFCKLHPREQLRLFCATCDKLTCRDCQLVEHKDHRYQFINEAAGKHREVLKKLLQYLTVNLGLLNETISDVENVGKVWK
eukprot:gene18212-20030_t